MAFDAFLKLDGIDGESTDDKHKGEIRIESFSWGVSNAGSFAGGTGGGAGKATVQDFSFTADISAASPVLFLSSATGKHIKEGVITVRKAGEKPLEYYIIKLSDVLISSFDQGGATAGDVPMDQFSINYSKIEIEYKRQKQDGSGDTPVVVSYDLKSSTAG